MRNYEFPEEFLGKRLTLKELADILHLSTKSVKYALRQLKRQYIVMSLPDLSDMRRKVYIIKRG